MRAVIAASLLVIAAGVVRAQTQPAAQRPVPAAVNTIVAKPDAFYGQVVSITASVDRQLSPTTFVVDHDRMRSSAEELLVIAPTLQLPLAPATIVTIVGEAIRFDPADLVKRERARDYKLDLGADVVSRYQGRPAILAGSVVVNPGLVDLARRVPPPMTPMEEMLDKVMKRVGPASNELRAAATASNAAGTAEQAKILRAAFSEAEAFWKARGTADALEWNRTAIKHVDAIQKAAAAGDWSAVKTSVDDLNRSCSTCHGAYRERFDDGTYRVRSSQGR